MTTTEAFLHALDNPAVKSKFAGPNIRNWRSRAKRGMISEDFKIGFLLEHGYHILHETKWSPLAQPDATSREWNKTPIQRPTEGNMADEKAQLSHLLYTLRKEMDLEVISKWYDGCAEQYNLDYPERKLGLTDSAFYNITAGRPFGKLRVVFVVKMLKLGRKLQHEYQLHLRTEMEGI